jgi:hypothetical protein
LKNGHEILMWFLRRLFGLKPPRTGVGLDSRGGNLKRRAPILKDPLKAALGELGLRQVLRHIGQAESGQRRVKHLGGFSTTQDFNGDIALFACFASSWTPAMVRRWHADPFGFLRPWNDVPALMGSAPPATPPSTGTGVVTFLMG